MKKLVIAALLLPFVSQAAPKLQSVYTKVGGSSCVIYDAASLHKQPEIDFLTLECPGLGGYQVMISGGDLRYPLQLAYGGKDIQLTNVGSFHDVGSKYVEWLYERVEGKANYKALIHRISYSEASGKQNLSMLVVTKLDKENTCAVATVLKSKDMNKQARAIAAKADTLPCLSL